MFKPVSNQVNFPQMEEEVLKFWQDNRIFAKSLEQRRGNQEFVFYDGPPFATGLPHYGHLLAGTIKDVVPRYQTMRGKYVPRTFGWDCHGLPVENEMEKTLHLNSKKDIEKFGTPTSGKRLWDGWVVLSTSGAATGRWTSTTWNRSGGSSVNCGTRV